jgi:sugar phosphate isomerase/epimerase
MNISVSTLALSPKPLDKVLGCLEDRGLKNCEVIHEYPYNSISKDMVDSYNIKITVHSPLSDINIASYNETIRRSSVSQIKKSIDLASSMEPCLVVVHPGQIPILGKQFREKILANSKDSLTECTRYAEDRGVMLCVENMPDIEGLLGKDINELDKMVEEIGAYMTLDVGHANNMGFEISEMVKSSLIKHIHLSDNDGSFDNHNSIGSVNIDFKTLFKELNKLDYGGILVVEVKDPESVNESLDYLKNNFKNLF